MRRTGLTFCLAAALMAGAAAAQDRAAPDEADQPSPAKARAAERKAGRLEEKAAEGGAPPRSERITGAEARAVDPAGAKPLDDPLTCLARTVYWEDRGGTRAAMEAIADVVMNRVGKAGFPDTVCGVVRQGKETGACQFSWWCDGRPDEAEEPAEYALAKEIAREALNGQLRDRTGGALYFHGADGPAPAWAGEYVRTATIGGHVFLKPRDGAAR
jgi:spore germination cell wall hydrolase CwlJ-like protein